MEVYIGGVEDVATLETTGISYNIYFAGCRRQCAGCHNPHLFSQHPEQLTTTEDVFETLIKNIDLADYVCFLGGEPLDQYEALVDLILKIREVDIPVWVYTGYPEEEIKTIEDGELWNFLVSNCHTIKVGDYDPTKGKGITLASANQRYVAGKQFTI